MPAFKSRQPDAGCRDTKLGLILAHKSLGIAARLDQETVVEAAARSMHAIHFDHVRNQVAALAARLRGEFDPPA
ncbi:hypothetical protein [Ramlibacter humi]|uniref:Uncharacterized protein n=1 Tax=Ramlibacter humi TaxID=2530451 RepID=A0A4Z0BE40_9BURK|nr:hypothetical protein [Ramlibacter humi]TFY96168.1 hypothetical protein EZ216_21120 [Ramlibacter humi]